MKPRLQAGKISLREICEKLRVNPEFYQFITAEIEGRLLQSSTTRFSKEKGLLITLSYTPKATLSDNGVLQEEDKEIPSRHQKVTSGKNQPSPKPASSKKRTPSRRQRDRERFRLFLERKRARKTLVKQKSVSKPDSTSANAVPVDEQCMPPPDLAVTLGRPPPLTLSFEQPVISSLPDNYQPEITDPKPSNSPAEDIDACPCGYCSPITEEIVNFDPTNIFLQCSYCELPASCAQDGLKQCTRCLSTAYCSKSCQKKDWREGDHKDIRSEEKAEYVRQFRRNALERKERAMYILRLHNCRLVH